MFHPGPRNLITDVPGLRVGCAEDAAARTGTTVVMPDAPAMAGVDVRGGAPGTRETDLMDPACLVERVDAVALSGGSAFGLDAAQGVMRRLRRDGRGYPVGNGAAQVRVPIVPAAILFDLLNGGAGKDSVDYAALGEAACAAAGLDFRLGNSGAGMGARAGALKGGLGSASLVGADGLAVGALIAVNPVGSVTIGDQPQFWAWALEQGDEFGGLAPPEARAPAAPFVVPGAAPGGATIVGVVATNAPLSAAQARRTAIMAQDGLARAVRPVHTPFDGDVLFALGLGEGEPVDPLRLALIGALAADCVARAIARGVHAAETLGDMICWRERFGR